jgi:hypothetical protein
LSYFDEIIPLEDREEICQGAFRFVNALSNCDYMLRVFLLIGVYKLDQLDRTSLEIAKRNSRTLWN